MNKQALIKQGRGVQLLPPLFRDAFAARQHAEDVLERVGEHRAEWEPVREARPAMLERLADGLEAARAELLGVCSEETGLTQAELAPEFARMTGTLRMFAGVVREGSWVRASIDHAPRTEAERKACIGPPHDVRRMLVPLGSCAGVFGASNFPFAYGVCGGDTASALAAGLSVVVKEHPAQPRVGRALARVAQACAAPVAYVVHEDAKDMRVARRVIEAVDAIGFTGSVAGGDAVAGMAHALHKPAFCEMGSANLVDVGHEAIATAGQREALAKLLGESIVMRVGQQCTRPGIISVVRHEGFDDFVSKLAGVMDAAAPRRMLSEHVAKRYEARIKQMVRAGCSVLTKRSKPIEKSKAGELLAVPVLLGFGGAFDLEDVGAGLVPATVLDEVFGPAAMVVPSGELVRANQTFARPRLTTTLHGAELSSNAPQRAGRIVFGGVPTGVRVCQSMVHSGPYPACNAPATTAVGALAMERWCKWTCWQNGQEHALPEELRAANPRGMMRVVDGVWGR